MKKYENKVLIQNSQTISSVTCNACSKEIYKNKFGHIDDYIEVQKEWGFHSSYDGEKHNFDLCQSCYKKITGEFSIPPEVLKE